MSSGKDLKPSVIPGVTKLYLRVPLDRVGVLIGGRGAVLRELEGRTGVKVVIDSEDGSVVIEPPTPATPVYNLLKAREFIRAIAVGFPPEKAWRLLEEDQVLIVINLKDVVGSSINHLTRIKGRIIGEGGKVRRNLEEMTGTYITIYNDLVSIIGDYESARVAREAIEMIIRGRQHSTIYRYVDRAMREIKRKRITSLWLKPYNP
ncbi:MAG: RNA-processing protein [Desulfurococcales archaeon ex4484_204]|nr:MAG: RNA-processing protein [Desulfurococcales archaeon ex4484_204]